MAHCAGPGDRQAAQAPAAERQACPCAEGASAGSLGRVRVSAVGPKSRIRCAPACDMLRNGCCAWDPARVVR
eukprot:3047478-Prymnesium_polylepis.1